VAAVALLIPWLPDPASEQADRIDFVFWFVTAICIAIFALVATNPASRLIPERARIALDGRLLVGSPWRTILFHKPRGVLTTSRDPKGRPTIFELLGDTGRGLVAVGRLDFASSGLLLLTNDTRLADWITSPDNAVPRVYVVTVRGCVEQMDLERLTSGLHDRGDHLKRRCVAHARCNGEKGRRWDPKRRRAGPDYDDFIARLLGSGRRRLRLSRPRHADDGREDRNVVAFRRRQHDQQRLLATLTARFWRYFR
jgi:hypothetical protein